MFQFLTNAWGIPTQYEGIPVECKSLLCIFGRGSVSDVTVSLFS